MTILKKSLALVLLFMAAVSAWAQCPSGNVELNTQAEVDAFVAQYPNCTEIESSLGIAVSADFPSDITDISGLSNLTSVGWDLWIGVWYADNASLTSLNGLNNITSVGGDLWISFQDGLTSLSALDGITSVGGNLDIRHNDVLTSLSGLDNITSLGGNLSIINNNALTSLGALDNITSVEGDLNIRNNGVMSLSGLDNITSVGGDLWIDNNTSLMSLSGLDNITSVGGDLDIRNNGVLTSLSPLDNLTSLGGNLRVGSNDVLTSLNGLDNLTSIGGDLEIDNNTSLTSLNGLNSLTSIEGGLKIDHNIYLTSLSALDNITSIGGDLWIEFNTFLESLSGLDNITSVGGDLWIGVNTSLSSLNVLGNINSLGGNLSIIENYTLTSLSGLDNITSVEGDLEIWNNNNLASMTGLGNLTSVGGDLEIAYNYVLTSLSDFFEGGLENLTSIGGNLEIFENDILATCGIPIICSHIMSGGITDIRNNASGCNSPEEVLDNYCALLPKIYNNTFYDLNQNKIRDNNEPDYKDAAYLINGNPYTTIDGNVYLYPLYYTIDIDNIFYAHYNVALDSLSIPNWQLTTDSLSYTYTQNLDEATIDTVSFGLYPIVTFSDMRTSIVSPPTRCNEVVTLDVVAHNFGTTTTTGTMWLTLDESISVYSFVPQPDTIGFENNTFGWHFEDLYPSYSHEIQVDVQVPGPPDFTIGNTISFEAYGEFTDVNGSDELSSFSYTPEVRCSYDPNDKLVHPNREGNYTLFDEDLIYTIRFQNTGNDYARNVVIRDTLDSNLDHRTFRLLGSSHSEVLTTNISDEGIIAFVFEDIYLLDSTTNFEASQGYVNYLIEPFGGLDEATLITNTAGIYFDFNPPIITNTVESVMVSELPIVSTTTPIQSLNFSILPNPTNGIFTIQGIENGIYQIHNTAGQIIGEGRVQQGEAIDLSRVAQGIYFVSVTVDKVTAVRRILKM